MIETRGLTRVFRSRSRPPKVAVDRVDLSVARGTIHGLIGPNGAGKSTLVALLCTLITPTAGDARVNGFDVRHQGVHVRRSIALNFGGERAFYSRLSIERNLEFFAAVHGMGRRQAASAARGALERLGLWADRRTHYSECSTGMKKRLNFARAMMLDAPLYICDEPTTGVDVDSAIQMRQILRELRQQDRTVLLITHNLEEVGALADRVGLMQAGRIVHEDSPLGLRAVIAPRVVSIELSGDAPAAFFQDLRNQRGVDGLDRVDGHVRLTASEPELLMPSVMRLVSHHEVAISSVGVVRPGLEEVFQHLILGCPADQRS